MPYDLRPIDFSTREQKAEWYVALNPNGRIPTIVDRGNDDFVVFESGAVLWYLAEKYECFLPSDPKGRSRAMQWIMFQVAGVGPMMGQAMYFQRIAEPARQSPAVVVRSTRCPPGDPARDSASQALSCSLRAGRRTRGRAI